MGEIKFTAEKACSSAKLKVKGKHVKSQHMMRHALTRHYFQLHNGVFGVLNINYFYLAII